MLTFQEGQPRLATVTLTVADGSTVAALVVISPADVQTPIAASVVPDTDNLEWQADATYILTAGEWIERWLITGTGGTTIDNPVQVAPKADAIVTGQRVYATSGDYAKLLHTAPPSGIRRRLAEASRVVDDMLWCAVYDTDGDKMPTDPEVITALRDATCFQAEYAAEIGDAYSVGANQYQQMTLGPATLMRAPGDSGPAHWSRKAWNRLAEVPGLVGMEPYS